MLRPKHLSLITSRLVLGGLLILLTLFNGISTHAQTEITGIGTSTSTATTSTTQVTAPSDASNSINSTETYDIMYGDLNDIAVTSYTVSGVTYEDFLFPDTLVVRRTDGGNFINIWYSLDETQGGGDGITNNAGTPADPNDIWLEPTIVADADAIYQAGIINGGYDNILVNDDDLAGASIQAQVERVDIIWYSGIRTADADSAVYPVIERGGNDNIKIAGITSLDANGDPSGYTSLVTISDTDWDATFAGVDIGTQLILRRQIIGDDPIPILDNAQQEVYGVAVSFADLGIADDEISYGFSIFASDVTTENLVLFNTFPNTTLSSVSGLDLVAGLAAAVSSDGNLIDNKGPGGYKAALSTWLKANDGAFVTSGGAASTDGDAVGFWEDQSVGNHDFTTLGTAPTFNSTTTDINFNPSLDFVSATDRGLVTPNNSDYNDKVTNNGFTNKGINIVFRTDDTDITTKQQLYEQGGGSNGLGIYIRAGDVHLSVWNRGAQAQGDWNDDNSGVETVSATIAADTEYIITMEFAGDGSGSKNGSITGYLNGQLMGSLTDPFSQGVGLLYDHTGAIGLGNHNGASRYDDGGTNAVGFYEEIAEFIYCNEPSNFPLGTRQEIESYLAIKYGITLDQSTAYNYVDSDGNIIFNTTNAASIGGYLEYNNDIAGIGRDDDSELLQLKSKSENMNSIVTVEKTVGIGNNGTWLIWGNDGASTAESGALTMPDTISKRVTRVWRVAEENEMGATSISFDLNELGLSTSSPDPYSLLVAGTSSNADFSSATVITGGTISSGVITFTGVNLEDGEYFTLGTEFFICTPGNVRTNLALWLKADAETYNTGTTLATNGQTVETWGDQGENNFDATNDGGVTNRAPTWAQSTINFNPGLNFPNDAGSNAIGFNLGSNYIFGDDADGGVHIFSAIEPIDVGTNNNTRQQKFIYNFGNRTAASYGLGSSDQRGTLQVPGTNSNFNISPEAASFLAEADFDISAGTSDTRQYLLDGTVVNTLTVSYQLDNASITEAATHGTDQGPVSIGRQSESNGIDSNNGRRFFGDMAEVIVYNGEISDLEAQQVRSYLALKYGSTLTNDNDADAILAETLGGSVTEGDYVASDGTTIHWNYSDHEPTYINDVAGIGRDDDTCLEQKQSRSVNSDDIITMGLGEIAADNAANPNSFAGDKNFLVWANDNASTAFADRTTLGTPGTVSERMLRVWKVQETGTVGATDISFDLTGLPGYSTDANQYQMIIASGGDNTSLDAGTTVTGGTFNGSVLTFSGVNLTDGQFFTLGIASDLCAPGGITSNMMLWLRADGGTSTTTDNTTLATWTDQSLASNNATDDGNPPLFKSNTTDNINFLPTIDFDGSNDRLGVGDLSEIKSGTGTGDYTMIGVGIRQDANDNYVIGSTGGTNDQEVYFGYNGATSATIDHENNALNITGLNAFGTPAETPFLLYADYDGTGRTLEEHREGTMTRNTDSNTTDISGTQTNYIGDVDGTGNYNGLISEVLVYDRAVTDLEKLQILSYFGVKYGITLPRDNDGDLTPAEVISGSINEGDYVASDGTTIFWDESNGYTTYHNDIASIGRDDDACLNQRQSTSANNDDIITIGLGSVAVDNASNGSVHDNLDFFTWGNDDGATAQASANTVDVPSTVSERMTRVWRVEDIGTVGATEIQFDLTGLGYGTNADDFRMIISNSPTMASGTLTNGATFNGSVLSFTGINLTDGQYFTLATALETCGPGGVNTNLSLWYRTDLEIFSDAGTTPAVDNDDVVQWNDQSSPAANGSESNLGGGTPVEPSFQTEEINFNPVLRIIDPNSTNAAYIESATMTEPTGNFTLVSVFQSGQDQGVNNDFINTPALISGAGNGSEADYGLGFFQGAVILNADNDANFDVTTTSSNYNDNNPHIALATRTQSGGAVEIFMTGETDGTGTGDTGALGAATTIGIGNHSDGDVQGQFNGDIAESIIFSSVLTGEEQSRVETYLAIKYGLTISNNRDGDGTANELIDTQGAGTDDDIHEGDYVAGDGDIIWDYADQGATYYNDIFGIGRDDLSCFEQIKSKSESSDAMVTFDNTSSFNDNDSWLISGNDNAPVESPNNTERPPSIKSRLNREWRVQETGTVGQIELTYDLSSVTGTPLGDNNLNLVKLMVDDDGDFTTGVTLIDPSSIDGGAKTVTFQVNFTDGQYYTLGSTEVNALPITLISFGTSKTSNNQVEIFWTTAEEINNSFYTIERSRDGLTFEAIGFKEGAGNSNEIIDYSFIDTEPLDGVSYYRLKQTDFNGEFDYSEVSRISLNIPNSSVHQVVPNPVNRGENFVITYPVTVEREVKIAIANANGITTYDRVVAIKPEDGEIEVTTSNLSRGLYFIRIVDQNLNNITLKFIVR